LKNQESLVIRPAKYSPSAIMSEVYQNNAYSNALKVNSSAKVDLYIKTINLVSNQILFIFLSK
jgi:hypothetical protein